MWKLQTETGDIRTYSNSTTGSQCNTKKVYKDKEGNDWYMFSDLMMMPDTRNFAATKISSLYALGLSKTDLTSHIEGLKSILKSNDKEKYEKAYANVLDFENKANNATDAIKQMSSLVCVYFLINDEPIDSFLNDLQVKKMNLLEANAEMHGFFLSKQIDLIERYQQHLKILSQIVSPPQNGKSEVLV